MQENMDAQPTRYGLTIYPPSTSPSDYRKIGPYKYRSELMARVAARMVSAGFPMAGDTINGDKPRALNYYVAVETIPGLDYSEPRYRRGRKVR